MNKRELRDDDEAVLQVKEYVVEHPRSPSAVRQPKVSRQGDTFIALLGLDLQHGIVGLGNTVKRALRAFDLQYLSASRAPGGLRQNRSRSRV